MEHLDCKYYNDGRCFADSEQTRCELICNSCDSYSKKVDNVKDERWSLECLDHRTGGYGTCIMHAVMRYNKYGDVLPSPCVYPEKEHDVKVLSDALDELSRFRAMVEKVGSIEYIEELVDEELQNAQ